MPAWVGEIGLVVTYIDPRLDVGILDRLAEQVDPAKTLLYLNQWRKDPFTMLITRIIRQNLSLVVLLKRLTNTDFG